MHEVLVLASNYDTGKPRWVEIYIQCIKERSTHHTKSHQRQHIPLSQTYERAQNMSYGQ